MHIGIQYVYCLGGGGERGCIVCECFILEYVTDAVYLQKLNVNKINSVLKCIHNCEYALTIGLHSVEEQSFYQSYQAIRSFNNHLSDFLPGSQQGDLQ